MKRKQSLKRCLSLFLSSAMVVGLLPAAAVNAAEPVPIGAYLTDAQGAARTAVGKVASDNHEIIDIHMTDGQTHKVTIYLLDEDASGRWSMVDVIDPDTQKLLDSQNVYDFSEGVYLSWNISGHLQIRLTNVWTKRYTESKDTAIHGIFIDGKDAIADGQAVVMTEEPGEDTAANAFEGINVLGRYAASGESFTLPFDKEVQSVELRFNGNIDPASENLDKIRVLKDGQAIAGEVRSSFQSVTFVPAATMKDGSYTVEIPADVKNSAGQELGAAASASFEVETKTEVIYFRDGMNYMTRRVELAFNDRLKSSPQATMEYKGKSAEADRIVKLTKKGRHGGMLFEVQDNILPSGTYRFTLPSGTTSVSGAVCGEDYVKEFLFDSTQLSAKIDAPAGVDTDQPALLEVEECFGYGEMRYAFSEEALAQAAYEPVKEEVSISTEGLVGNQTLYVQFRVNAGEKEGTESPILHKTLRLGLLKRGELRTFDMQGAGAYDKDGFGSTANKMDGVFDLATDTWIEGNGGTSNYIADGTYGLEGRYDQDKDARITTEKGIPYQLSTDIYVDGRPNVATGNGKEIPAPSENAYERIYVLAAGKYDDNVGTFTMKYADGTSTTEEINAHYWAGKAHPENIVFENISTCLGWSGNGIYSMGVMRQYELKPDASKALTGIVLPKTSNLIRIFAMTGKEADVFGEAEETKADLLSHTEGETEKTAEELDPTYDEFIQIYGDDAELREAADITDVTNIQEVAAGERTYDETILAEKAETTGGYGQGLYPYARQPEKLMSYKIRMQSYEDYELDVEDALEAIRRIDNLSRGLEKKCYLVGWQTNGHDTGFPYFGEVNPRHRRPMDETALDSLKWLMQEAKKYHTTITLHVNFSDAYADDDPISQSMIEQQIPIRYANGEIHETGFWSGHKGFMVSACANYFTGNWQKNQIDPLIAMLPDLEGQSLHPDAWYSWSDPYYGLSSFDTADAQRRHAKYMREKYNMDITTEFEFQFAGGAGADHVLYFPMIWQGGWTDNFPMQIPAYFQSTVNQLTYDGKLTAAGRYFGEGSAVEPKLWTGDDGYIKMPGLKESFAEQELTRQYLNTLLRTSLTDNEETGGTAELCAGDGQQVTSTWNGDNSNSYKRTVTVGQDVVLQEPGNVFMPMTWRPGLEIQAWSRSGYTDKTWKLPVEWDEVQAVDVYDLSLEGLRYSRCVDVEDREILLTLTADQTAVLVPAGNNPNSTKGFERNGSVQFLGRDTETGGNWTKTYGKEGYDLFEEENSIPDTIEIQYVNGAVKTVKTGFVEVKSVKLSQTEARMEKGGTLTLKATVNPVKATDKTVTWSSSDSDVAAVEAGAVTAVEVGTATITARAGNVEASCEITVIDADGDTDKEAAASVDEMIAAIGEVSLASKETIAAARAAYEALSDAAKGYVTKLEELEAAEAKLAQLEASEEDVKTAKAEAASVDEAIAAIGDVSLASKEAIEAVRASYEALSILAKSYVTKLEELEAAEEALDELETAEKEEKDAKAAAEKVEEMIRNLGTVTEASKADIEAARAAYHALSDAAKKQVANLVLLEAAEKKLEEILKPVSVASDIAKADIKAIPAQLYSGKALKPALAISYQGVTLMADKDYTAVYSNNKNIGTASVQIAGIGSYTGSIAVSFQITVKKKAVYTVGNYKYKITNANTNGNGAVSLTGVKSKSVGKKLKKIMVAKTVKIGGRKFLVTEISGKAFSGCKKVTSATIGANVTKIGANAFNGCRKLTKITINSKKLKSVGKNAFKNISPKAKIKAPKSKLKAYQKILKGKGQKESVKITF